MAHLARVVVPAAGAATQFLYDGDELVAEYGSAGTLLRRYGHGIGNDDPVLWYEGSGLTTRRGLFADQQGSIVAVADSAGNKLAINAYDSWGIPNAGNLGRFGYTGQAWLPELGMSYYKARIYSPTLGRFLQTDPVGYDDQINLYAYVGNDPVNSVDPDGTCRNPSESHICAHQHRERENARREGIREAWRQERRLVANGGGTRNWTPAQRNELIRNGYVRGFQGHHINTVNGNNLALARNPDNIRFVTPAEHAEIHRLAGGTRVAITGQSLISRGVTGKETGPILGSRGFRLGTGAAAGRVLGIGGIVTSVTGMLSGRIRTDGTILDTWYNMIGLDGPTDIIEHNIRSCGTPEPCA